MSAPTRPRSTHTCPGCGNRQVPRHQLACRPCWYRLPRDLRDQLNAAAYEQAVRQRWRALALVIKAKLEAVQAGIVEFDQEFLAHIVIGGRTVGEALVPQLQRAIDADQPPALLPGGAR